MVPLDLLASTSPEESSPRLLCILSPFSCGIGRSWRRSWRMHHFYAKLPYDSLSELNVAETYNVILEAGLTGQEIHLRASSSAGRFESVCFSGY